MIDFSKEDCFKTLVTEDIARSWLERNFCNRPISQSLVEMYERDMKEGRWKTNGATICFSKNGELIDGQHRLTAIVHTGIPQYMWVMTGITKTCHIDDGRKRTLKDQVLVMGVAKTGDAFANTTILAAVKFLYGYWKTGNGRTHRIIDRPPTEEMVKWMQLHEEAVNLAADLSKKHSRTQVNLNLGFVAAAIMVCSLNGVPENQIREWHKAARTGEYQNETQVSAIKYRNLIIKAPHSKESVMTPLFLQAQHSIKVFGIKKISRLNETEAFPFEWEIKEKSSSLF